MAVSTHPNPLSALVALTRMTPARPLKALLRSTTYRLMPPRPKPHAPAITRARAAALMWGKSEPRQLATVLCEHRFGDRPTIVMGGFVPDSSEQVFLLRHLLLKSGSIYYLNYAPGGFSLDLLCAQIEDLVEELTYLRGQKPVLFGVSFGCGLVVEWLRRARASGRERAIAGTVLVSPVACTADILAPNEAKPSTLVGRALAPYLAAGDGVAPAVVEKSRTIFAKMFESGAQNKGALKELMSPAELRHLHERVMATIRGIDVTGAVERVGAMNQMDSGIASEPTGGRGARPLSSAPTLILYAEKEGAVIHASSPTRALLEFGHRALFPQGEFRVVSGGSSPVQHASLIFHSPQFLPHLSQFYRELKSGKFRLAA